VIFSTLKNELQLFDRWRVSVKECENPFAWWLGHETQFPNMVFFANQVFGIAWFQNGT
jgi:hypothetical protein